MVTPAAALSFLGHLAMNVKNFRVTELALGIEDCFSCKTKAEGVFQDIFGNVGRQFAVDNIGTMIRGELVLSEYFVLTIGCSHSQVVCY